jgi:hypothetical protein
MKEGKGYGKVGGLIFENIMMKGKDFKKEDYVLLAKLAQQTERYD